MITPEIIGKNIIAARNEMGYTQKDLADKLAISPQNISKWERGISTPDVITLLQISEVLNKDINYFLISNKNTSIKEMFSASVNEGKAVSALEKYVDSVFSNTNWYKQHLCEIKRTGIYLSNSIMRHSEFLSSEISHCRVKDCQLSHCSSTDSKMNDTEIYRCFFRFMKLKNTSVSSCKINATLYKCNFGNCDFSAIVFDNCNIDAVFEHCTFNRIALKNCKKTHHCSLINCELDNMSAQAFRENGAMMINCTIKED